MIRRRHVASLSTAILASATLVAPAFAAESTNSESIEMGTDEGPVKILGGTATAVGDFPTVVGLTVGGGICTATLIDKEWVLTAAHCISASLIGLPNQEAVTQNLTVVVDSVTLFGNGGRRLKAKKTIPHPMFSVNRLGSHDIGLIQLATPITDRQPTPVNLAAAKSPVGITVTMVGYGMTNPANQNSAGKQFVVRDRKSVSCSGFAGTDQSLLCFNQSDGKGKCQGDSGGPSFATIDNRQVVVGVTSFGDQGCESFGADTRPEFEKDFLMQHMGDALKCASDGVCGNGCGQADIDCPQCDSDSQCGDNKFCDAGTCKPDPFSDGGLGAACTANDKCFSGACALYEEENRCTQSCNVASNNCPSGFDCLDAGGGNGACWPGEQTGCCSSTSSPADVAPLAFLVGLLLLRRRRS